ncbi:MAG: sulfate adenylyltransferase subunit CysN, partial [Pseudomonadota bacterium]
MNAPNPELTAKVKRLYDVGEQGVLRFITCGSVDDGKSTLIGRLLYDSKLILEDHLAALSRDSRKFGTTGDDMDFALLLDGLEAEREQGITIDVAYRFFATERRKFIVADTPGHEQYTRNMATGASTADLAILLVDARKGVLPQTRRHTYIVNLLGIKNIVLAINKMDLVDYSSATYHQIMADYLTVAEQLGFESILAVPISARNGDNVSFKSENTPWYEGPTLIERLETIDVETDLREHPFRLPVQWVNRPNLDFRGFSGTVTSGVVRPGDRVAVSKSGRTSRIKEIATADGDLDHAEAGQAVTLVLEDEIDISRGDVLAAADARPEISDQFAARIIWMHEEPLLPGRSYLFKAGAQATPGSITALKHKVDIETYDPQPATTLELNEIGLCNIEMTRPIAFDPYSELRDTGSFVIIDRFTNQTVGAGMIQHGLRRATNIHHQHLDVDKTRRSELKDQTPAIVWFTGLSGAGKSTIANMVE